MTAEDVDVQAAGGLLRRETGSGPEFCLVHRPRYLDWTIPKGKLEPGESHRDAAIREIEEETGFGVSVGAELPGTRYLDNEGRTKMVRYWIMTPTSGAFGPNDEVDELKWLPAAEALGLLTHEHDRSVIEAAIGLDSPLLLIRHAKAEERSGWAEDDRLRPLTNKGRRQAEAIAEALASDGATRIASSPYVRCVLTVRPLALALGLPVEAREELAEGGNAEDVWAWASGLKEPTVICSHGDLIPAMIQLAEREGAELPATRECRKGSVWRLERRAGLVVSATYLPPR
jgi:8-oxo-dGTP diphosphatase